MSAATLPISRLLALTTLLFLISTGFAHASSNPWDDFQPNCDIRQLNLSAEQHEALRKIRSEYKQASDRAHRKNIRAERNRRQVVTKILTAEYFDQNAARDYVESRYLSKMDFAVDELNIQHRIFHMLNHRQRQQWLSSCLR